MIRAGSLIYALSIALILSILSASLILLAFNTRTAIDSNLISEKQISNVISGLNYYLTNSQQWEGVDGVDIDLFEQGNDSVKIAKKQWGFFEVLSCRAQQGNKKADGFFLVGDKAIQAKTALHLADQNKPLALCGKTLIRGNSFLPAQGVKRAYIEGQNFVGSKLIEGNIKSSTGNLPEINKNFSSSDFPYRFSETDSIMDIGVLESNKTLSNSFGKPTIVLISKTDLELDNYQLSGNIIIQCDGQTIIRSSTGLSDILILSRSILIDKNFTGAFQGFSKDSIIAGENSHLQYPGALCIGYEKNSTATPSKIVLKRNSQVKGNVVNYHNNNVQSKAVNLQIEEGCVITGLAYSKGYVDFKGSIEGSLYCNGFILKTPSAVYENHLLNVTINSEALPPYYIGNFSTEEVKRKAAIKRLL